VNQQRLLADKKLKGIIKAKNTVGKKIMNAVLLSPAVRFLALETKDPGQRGGIASWLIRIRTNWR